VAVTGQSVGGATGAALVGALIVVVFGLGLWLVFRSAVSAHRVGRLGDGLVNWVLHFFHRPSSDRFERSVLRFRDQTNEVVHQRGAFDRGGAGQPGGGVCGVAVLCSGGGDLQ
jgi:hypothetical protein